MLAPQIEAAEGDASSNSLGWPGKIRRAGGGAPGKHRDRDSVLAGGDCLRLATQASEVAPAPIPGDLAAAAEVMRWSGSSEGEVLGAGHGWVQSWRRSGRPGKPRSIPAGWLRLCSKTQDWREQDAHRSSPGHRTKRRPGNRRRWERVRGIWPTTSSSRRAPGVPRACPDYPAPIPVVPVRGQMAAFPWPAGVPPGIVYGSHVYVVARFE